jgi:hypothetical protein
MRMPDLLPAVCGVTPTLLPPWWSVFSQQYLGCAYGFFKTGTMRKM